MNSPRLPGTGSVRYEPSPLSHESQGTADSDQSQLANRARVEEEVGRKLARTEFNRTLVRIGASANRDSLYALDQLRDNAICPREWRGFVWKLLEQSLAQQTVHWVADEGGLSDVALSPDGSWLATSGPAGVRVWEADSGKLLAKTSVQSYSPAVRLCLDQNSQSVFFCRHDGHAVRFDVASGSLTALERKSKVSTTAVTVIADNPGYVIGDRNGTVECWSSTEKVQRWEQKLNDEQIVGLTVSADGKRLGVISVTGELFVCNLSTGVCELTQQVTSKPGFDVQWFRGRFANDLQSAVLCGQSIAVWDLKKRQMAAHFPKRHNVYPDAIPIDTDELEERPAYIITARSRVSQFAGENEIARIFHRDDDLQRDAATGDGRESTVDTDPVLCDATAHGDRVAIALRGGRVMIVSRGAKPVFETWETAHPTVVKLRFSSDGSKIAAHSGGGAPSLFDAQTGTLIWQRDPEGNRIHDLHFTGDDQYLAVRQERHGISLWNARLGKRVASAQVPQETREIVPWGDRLLMGSVADKAAWLPLIPGPDGLQFGEAPYGINAAMRIAVTDKSSGLIAHAYADGRVNVARIETDDTFRFVGDRQLGDVAALTFVPGGQALVIGFRNGAISIFKPDQLDEIVKLDSRARPVAGLDVSPDGTVMASGFQDGEVLFWDTETWEPQLSVRTGLQQIRDIRFSPTGALLVASGKGGYLAAFRLPADDTTSNSPDAVETGRQP